MEIVFFLLDGCRPDKLLKANTPNMDMLMDKGVYSTNCRTVYPSLTAAGHMSILTGCYPEKTGIISHFYWDYDSNRFYEIFSDNYCQAKTIFEILDEFGYSGGVYGAYFRRGAKDTLFKKLLKKLANFTSEKLNFIMGFLVRHPSLYKILRSRVVGGFEEFNKDFDDRKHQFYYVMFNDVDKTGHKYGSDSKEYIDVIEEMDRKIGSFLSKIEKENRDVYIVIMADHGHIPIRTKITLDTLDLSDAGYEMVEKEIVSAAGLIHYRNSKGKYIHGAIVSRHIQFWFDDKNDISKVANVLKKRKEFFDIREKEELKKYRLINERTGDLAFSVSDHFGFDFLPIGERGDHGGLTYEEMHVPLIVWSHKNNIKHKKIYDCHVTDITPTILDILNIDYQGLDGSTLLG